MSPEGVAAVVAAWLRREGLVLCRAPDAQLPLEGAREQVALLEVAALALDASRIPPPRARARGSYVDRRPTQPIPAEVVDHLRQLSGDRDTLPYPRVHTAHPAVLPRW